MTEKLTDEQLRDRIAFREKMERMRLDSTTEELSALRELLALRAERAKPTPSDEGLAIQALGYEHTPRENRSPSLIASVASAFASIRAEGSAELEATNAAMDDEIASHQDTLRLWNEFRAERDKLEAALRQARGWLSGWSSAEKELGVIDSALAISAKNARVAQPAESGATDNSAAKRSADFYQSEKLRKGAKP